MSRGWLWTNKSLEERVREIEVQKRDPSRIMQKERSRYVMDFVNSPVTLKSRGGCSQKSYLITVMNFKNLAAASGIPFKELHFVEKG